MMNAKTRALVKRIDARLKELTPKPMVCATCGHEIGPLTRTMASGGYCPPIPACEACGGNTWAFTVMTSTYDEAALLNDCRDALCQVTK